MRVVNSESVQILMNWADTKPEIRRVWIYGSRVARKAKTESDIDIAIDLFHESDSETGLTDLWFQFGEIWEHELGQELPWPIDLEFFDPKGTTPSIEKYLAGRSRLVYAISGRGDR